MAITKAMLARCQNPLKQAFCALDKDVQEAMLKYCSWQNRLECDGEWSPEHEPFVKIKSGYDNETIRLSPDTPTEPEVDWVEYEVKFHADGCYGVYIPRGERFGGSYWSFTAVIGRSDFLGIIYRYSTGLESLHTSIDRAFGTPVRVRFRK